MGTRHLQCVYVGGEYKVAKYCQWDGYPDAVGVDTLKFIRDKMDEEKFKQALGRCVFVSDKEISELYEEAGIDIADGWVGYEDAQKFARLHPQIDRDMSDEIFEWIQESSLNRIPLKNSLEFASNSLACEWVYVLDLDRRTFEVYEGFNQDALDEDERFINMAPYQSYSESTYYPVKLAKLWDLSNLPSNQEFLNTFATEKEVL